MHKNKVMLVI